MTDYLTYVSTPTKEVYGQPRYTASSYTANWEDANLTIANLENENHLLRSKNGDMATRLNEQRGKLSAPQPATAETVKSLERQCRDLEDYISELEDRRGLVDQRILEDEKTKTKDLNHKMGHMEGNNQRLQQGNSMLERENQELRTQNGSLRKELGESKEQLTQSERMLATTKEKWELAEADRDKLRRDLKDAQDREIKHLEVIKQTQHRADTAQRELDAVYKWNGQRKCQCMKKKDAPEPWKKFMSQSYVAPASA
jgi:chromosome segregation ATPase